MIKFTHLLHARWIKVNTDTHSSQQLCKNIIDSCKEQLKQETDPQVRRSLAITGEEFNKTFLQLEDEYEPLTKVCTKCRKPRRKHDFRMECNGHRATVCSYCKYPMNKKFH